jgi:hypothetical protein
MRETVAGYGSHYFSSRGRCFANVQPVLERQLREALACSADVTGA